MRLFLDNNINQFQNLTEYCTMITFITAVILLVLGIYFTVNLLKVYLNQMSIDTSAYTHADGVDLNSNKKFLDSSFKYCGSRPNFRPNTRSTLWSSFSLIVLGCIFAGAVHDYLTGMISIRYGGAHLPALASKF
jgi:carbon starvation protein CstA